MLLNGFITKEELDFLNSELYLNDYPNILNTLNNPRFTIKDLGVTARDATYWDSKDILPKLKTRNTTRRKYTLPQALWIKIIQQLRDFDISLNQIKSIKDNLLGSEISVAEIFQDEFMLDIIRKIAEKQGILEQFNKDIVDPEILQTLSKDRFNLFELITLSTIIFRQNLNFIINKEGLCLAYTIEKHAFLVTLPEYYEMLKQPHIVVSISQAYSQIVEDWTEKIWFQDLSMLSNEEYKVIEMLRNEDIDELRIFKNDKKPERIIQVTKNKTLALKDFTKYVARNGYQTITVSTRNGKVVTFKNEVSIKL